MPSNPIAQRSDGVVRCRMLNDDIPVEICKTEQGVPECLGCVSPTRRCTACGKVNGIQDAEKGRCEDCARRLGGATPRTSSFTGTPEEALRTVLDRVRSVASEAQRSSGEAPPTSSTQTMRADFKAKPAILKDIAKLYSWLMEHAVERDEIWTVSMPAAILAHRAHLLPDEVEEVLTALVEEAYLNGHKPWQEAVLLKVEGIQELKRSLESPRGQFQPDEGTVKRPQRRRSTKLPESPSSDAVAPTPSPAPVPPVRRPKPAVVTPIAQPQTPPPTPRPPTPAKPLGTYAEAYASLVERSQMVGDQRIIRGAVPVLQMRWRIGPDDATKILEKLLRDRHISQRDGWRSIALLKDAIVDETPLPSKEVVRKTSVHTPQPSHGPRQRPPSVGSSGSSATPAIAAQADVALDPLDAAIQAVEAQLHALQQLHEGVAQEMQTLETCLSVLRRAKERGSELSPQLREALKGAALANAKLLAALSG